MVEFNTLVFSVLAVVPSVFCFTTYGNDFVDPNYILNKSFNTSTAAAQQSIVQYADTLGSQGPWSVMNKTVVPPTGNKHDYLSWAPYSWPNCTGVGNTTELTPEQIWVTCPYYTRDGLFNPDGRLVNDTGNFQALSDAVLFNAMAWIITGSPKYSATAANYVKTWFLNPDTAMTPNLNYAQLQRGPDGQNGTHTGVLDLKGMTKVTSGLLILRSGKSSDWPSDVDAQMNNWTSQYISWLQTSPIAYGEATATNNHGTFFYNQLAALQILVGDLDGAKNTTNTYFSEQYMDQIDANGEQPLEAIRTRPYHYRAYNLAAMITNARLGDYLGLHSFWNKTTTKGGTIKTALDYAITIPPGDEAADELYPDIAAVGATYGDADGKYAAFLAKADNQYPAEPYFLWDQPFSDSGLAAATPTGSSSHPTSSSGTSMLRVSSLVVVLLSSFILQWI